MKSFQLKSFVATAAAAVVGLSLIAPRAQADEIVVTGFGALMTGGPVAVALERGEFKKRGVDITAVQGSLGGGTTLRNMFGGGLPYAEVATSAAIAAFNEGFDIRIVNNSIRTMEDLFWVVMPDSPLKSIKDLVGKRLSFTSPRSISETVSNMALEAAGIKLESVNRLALGAVGAGLAALEKGGTDTAMINEPLYSARPGRYRVLFNLSNLPRMSQTVGVTTVEVMKKSPEKIRAIVEARRAATDFIYANPEEAGRLIAKRYGDTLPVDVSIRAVKHLVEIKYWSVGNIEMAGMEAMAKALERTGTLKGTVDWNKLVDRSFLPADLRN
jgi:NitT/TauT family transport system substrate-binding protein